MVQLLNLVSIKILLKMKSFIDCLKLLEPVVELALLYSRSSTMDPLEIKLRGLSVQLRQLKDNDSCLLFYILSEHVPCLSFRRQLVRQLAFQLFYLLIQFIALLIRVLVAFSYLRQRLFCL